MSSNFPLLTTKDRRTTLPSFQVRGIQKNVATLMQVTMEALLAVLLAVMGYFFIAIPELCESSVGIVELLTNRILQYLYYPQCKAMTSDRKTWLQ